MLEVVRLFFKGVLVFLLLSGSVYAQIGDSDGDGVDDMIDNCPMVPNPFQEDLNMNGMGDACEPPPSDMDFDGVPDATDNCPAIANSGQEDTNMNGIGDACEGPPPPPTDTDGDGVPDATDNCPAIANSGQEDTNMNGTGDACEGPPPSDTDGDGIADATDNCPAIANPGQEDADVDGIGNHCDPVSLPANTFGVGALDEHGKSVAFAGDFNKDGYGDYVVGTPGHDITQMVGTKRVTVKNGINVGKAEVISGADGAVLASLIGPTQKVAAGSSVAGGKDIDGDGYSDVVVAMLAKGVGTVKVLYGPAGSRTQDITGLVGGDKKAPHFPLALGDVNGDGKADIIIGAPRDFDPAVKFKYAGSVTVFSGSDLSPLVKIYGALSGARAGTAVAAGDYNGDGDAELIVGAPYESAIINGKRKAQSGSVTVYNASGSPLLKVDGAAGSQLGTSVASGDINKDGKDDILAGAPYASTKGVGRHGAVFAYAGDSGSLITSFTGSGKNELMGFRVATGDVNGDGFADMIFRRNQYKGAYNVTVRSGQAGFAQLGDLPGNWKEEFGYAISAGDINNDGKADLFIGAPGVLVIDGKKKYSKAGKVTLVSGASLTP